MRLLGTPALLIILTLVPSAESDAQEGVRADKSGASIAAQRPIYSAELAFLTPTVGETLRIVGRFHSWMGKTVTIEGTEAIFELGSDSVAMSLRDPSSRDQELVWEVRLIELEPAIKFVVLNAKKGSSPQEFYETVRTSLVDLSVGRRLAIVDWALHRAQEIGDAKLGETARKDLLTVLAEQAKLFDAAGSATDSNWLNLGEKTLGGDPEWIELVTKFALSHESKPLVRTQVEKLGYTRDWNAWRPEREYLEEIGMVRTPKGKLVTRERALLEQIIDRWNGDDNAIVMLRRFTDRQYQESSRKREAAEGMKRVELIVAWGYPRTVSWLRRGNREFEGWFYLDRFACLVDGNVFEWRLTR